MGRTFVKRFDFLFIFVFFDLAWFACVFLGRTEFSYLSLLLPGVLVSYLIVRKFLNKAKVFLALGILVSGLVFDFLMLQNGFISFPINASYPLPFWLISIWILFSFSMTQMGSEMRMPLWIGALLGTVFGPLSYKSGEAFQVLLFSHSATLYIYAIFWTLAFPLVLHLSKRFS